MEAPLPQVQKGCLHAQGLDDDVVIEGVEPVVVRLELLRDLVEVASVVALMDHHGNKADGDWDRQRHPHGHDKSRDAFPHDVPPF